MQGLTSCQQSENGTLPGTKLGGMEPLCVLYDLPHRAPQKTQGLALATLESGDAFGTLNMGKQHVPYQP